MRVPGSGSRCSPLAAPSTLTDACMLFLQIFGFSKQLPHWEVDVDELLHFFESGPQSSRVLRVEGGDADRLGEAFGVLFA